MFIGDEIRGNIPFKGLARLELKTPPHLAGCSVDQEAVNPRCDTEPSDQNTTCNTFPVLLVDIGISLPHFRVIAYVLYLPMYPEAV